MSWDAYIDNLIAQSKGADGSENVDRACIVGMDGGAPWTSAAHPSALKVSFGGSKERVLLLSNR